MAIVAALIVWFLFRRMRLGYEARAIGSSAGSARAGGISIGAVQVKLFLISGALAGLVGMQQVLVERGALVQNYEALLGFTGIAVAFLGQNNPIGIVFAAILWAILSRGETALQIETDVPREFVIILQSILILTVVIVYQIAKRRLARRQLQRAAADERAVRAAASVDVEQPPAPDRMSEVD
jgi:general nucleoside transport system permease protein